MLVDDELIMFSLSDSPYPLNGDAVGSPAAQRAKDSMLCGTFGNKYRRTCFAIGFKRGEPGVDWTHCKRPSQTTISAFEPREYSSRGRQIVRWEGNSRSRRAAVVVTSVCYSNIKR